MAYIEEAYGVVTLLHSGGVMCLYSEITLLQ
jgi:hypothetical protein